MPFSTALLIRVTGHDRLGVTHAASTADEYGAWVGAQARQSISSMGLDGILHLIGVRDKDLVI